MPLGWQWQSMNPGSTVILAASMTGVSRSARLRTSEVLRTATERPALAARACGGCRAAARVRTRALTSVQAGDAVTARRITAADGARIVALAAIYIAAARLGLALDAVSGFATLVWAPSGIALAAMLLFGYRIWPGVFLGALAANAMVGAPIAV